MLIKFYLPTPPFLTSRNKICLKVLVGGHLDLPSFIFALYTFLFPSFYPFLLFVPLSSPSLWYLCILGLPWLPL